MPPLNRTVLACPPLCIFFLVHQRSFRWVLNKESHNESQIQLNCLPLISYVILLVSLWVQIIWFHPKVFFQKSYTLQSFESESTFQRLLAPQLKWYSYLDRFYLNDFDELANKISLCQNQEQCSLISLYTSIFNSDFSTFLKRCGQCFDLNGFVFVFLTLIAQCLLTLLICDVIYLLLFRNPPLLDWLLLAWF